MNTLDLLAGPYVGPLLLLFGAYLVTIFVFAAAYWIVYLRDRSAFWFNADVLEKQERFLLRQAEQQISELSSWLYDLRLLSKLLQNNTVELTHSEKSYESRAELRFSEIRYIFRAVFDPPSDQVPGMSHYDVGIEKGSVLTWMAIPHDTGNVPVDSDECRDLVRQILKYLNRKVGELEREVEKIRTKTATLFTYIDFLYFSLISQTTVGYGDILPNSRSIRVMVAAQIIIAYLFLIVVINLILTSGM